ncbi:MAG: hypothetical protein ABMA64_31155 [Myxococcota bacterium]
MPRPTHAPTAPRLCDGRFVVTSRLARGSVSSTFRVYDTSTDTERALMLLLPDLVASEEARLFEQVTRRLAGIDHPQLLNVSEVGVARGVPFALLERCAHGTVADWMAAYGPIPPRTAAVIAVQLVDALTALHGASLAHGAIDPAALWLTEDGFVKLGALDRTRVEGSRAAPAGPAPFRPPDAGARAQRRDDVFAVGVTLWSMLEGEAPRGARDWERSAEAEPRLDVVVRGCVSLGAGRYPSVEALGEVLLEALEALPEDDDGPMRIPPNEVAVDRSAVDLAAALDPVTAPLHPLYRPTEDLSDERPEWLTEDPDAASEEPQPPIGFSLTMPTMPEPTPEPHPPTPRAPVAAAAPAPAPPPVPAAVPAAAVPSEALAEAADPQPTPASATSRAAPVEGGSWLGTLLWAAVAAGLMFGIVGILGTTLFLGVGAFAVGDGQGRAQLGQAQLYQALDEERAVVGYIGALGGDNRAVERAYLDYMRQRREPERLQAALAFLDTAEAEARRAEGGSAVDQAGLEGSLRKLRAARVAYESARGDWVEAAGGWTGRAAIALGLANPP